MLDIKIRGRDNAVVAQASHTDIRNSLVPFVVVHSLPSLEIMHAECPSGFLILVLRQRLNKPTFLDAGFQTCKLADSTRQHTHTNKHTNVLTSEDCNTRALERLTWKWETDCSALTSTCRSSSDGAVDAKNSDMACRATMVSYSKLST